MSYMKTKTTKTKSKKEIVLDGDNPQDYAEWETEMKFQIKAKLGAIGLEHFHGRHDYSLSEERGQNGKFTKITDMQSERRAPSPLQADGPRLEHIADRTLMEHLFAQDKSTLLKMTSESESFFRLYDIQKRYYEEREETVKGMMLSMTTGPLLQALQNMDSQDPKSAFSHAQTVKMLSGTLSDQNRDKLIDRFRDGRVHDDKFVGMKEDDDPYMFIQSLKDLRSKIIKYTKQEDKTKVQMKLTDEKLLETMRKCITLRYVPCMHRFDEKQAAEKTVTKLGEMLQQEYHLLQAIETKDKANGTQTARAQRSAAEPTHSGSRKRGGSL